MVSKTSYFAHIWSYHHLKLIWLANKCRLKWYKGRLEFQFWKLQKAITDSRSHKLKQMLARRLEKLIDLFGHSLDSVGKAFSPISIRAK